MVRLARCDGKQVAPFPDLAEKISEVEMAVTSAGELVDRLLSEAMDVIADHGVLAEEEVQR